MQQWTWETLLQSLKYISLSHYMGDFLSEISRRWQAVLSQGHGFTLSPAPSTAPATLLCLSLCSGGRRKDKGKSGWSCSWLLSHSTAVLMGEHIRAVTRSSFVQKQSDQRQGPEEALGGPYASFRHGSNKEITSDKSLLLLQSWKPSFSSK